jgi:IS30 family transposase
MSYTHLSSHERSVIQHLCRQGVSASRIARQLGRDRSTIGRELRRNTPTPRCRYLAQRADGLATQRRAEANGQRAKLRDRALREAVVKRLRLGWSPQVIAGRLRREHPRDDALHLSGMTVYRWLKRDVDDGGTLSGLLPRRGRGRKPNGTRQKRSPAPGKKRIGQRPPGAEHRSRFGHWEIDTLEGAHKRSYLVSLADRKSRYALLGKAKDKRADTIRDVTAHLMRQLPRKLRRTATADNGHEFDAYDQLEQDFDLTFYFADPYAPWQRGTNEQTNGLVRRFLPKGTDFNAVSDAQLAKIQSMLNNRPRVCLDYRTPAEVIPLPGVALRV